MTIFCSVYVIFLYMFPEMLAAEIGLIDNIVIDVVIFTMFIDYW